jgi:hypothetical protein
MTDEFKSFVEAEIKAAPVVAWGARDSNHKGMANSRHEGLPAARIVQVLSRLALAAESLRQHGFQPRLLSWMFERGKLHMAVREDGGTLVLFADNEPQPETMTALLEKFLALRAV